MSKLLSAASIFCLALNFQAISSEVKELKDSLLLSKTQFTDPFEGRDPFMGWTHEDKFEAFKARRDKIHGPTMKYYQSHIEELDAYVLAKSNGYNPKELETSLLKWQDGSMHCAWYFLSTNSDIRLQNFYKLNDHTAPGIFLTKEYREVYEYFF